MGSQNDRGDLAFRLFQLINPPTHFWLSGDREATLISAAKAEE
jgi:hypothetical protein